MPIARRPFDSRATILEISDTMSAACWGVMFFGAGGVGMSRLASCSIRNTTAVGLRALMDAVQRGQPVVGQVARHLLVGQDHQLLDQPVGLGLGLVAHTGHHPLGVELEGRLGGADLDRVALRAQGARHLARGLERRRPGLLGPGLAGEDPVHLAVGQAAVAAHARAVKGNVAGLGAVHLHLDRHRQLLLPRAQRAGAVGELLGQHRLDGARARRRWSPAAAPRAPAGRRDARRRSRRRCAPTRAYRPSSRRAEIASSKSCASSGSMVKVGRSVRSTRRALVRRGPPPHRPRRAGSCGRGRGRASAPRARRGPRPAGRGGGSPGRRACPSRPAPGRPRRRRRGRRRRADRARTAARRPGNGPASRARPRAERPAAAPAGPRTAGAQRRSSSRVSSAVGRASSRLVSGLSRALTSGLRPPLPMVFPLGR